MTDKTHRVVVTGVGAVSPMGVGAEALYEGLNELRSTASAITKFNTENHRVKFACTVPDFHLHPDIDPREERRMDPFAQFGMTAAVEAVKDSGLADKADLDRVGVLLGSGIGGILELEIQLRRMYEKGPRRVSPLLIPKMILDIVPGLIAMRYGFRNVNFGIASACASAAHGMGEAFRHVKHGYADAVVTGGCESGITECSLAGFSNMGALSKRNDDPKHASRPFDKNRDGFVMGEGAGVLVFESLEHAKKRGANIYAEVIGFGASCDAHHITEPAPGGKGAKLAMEMALEEAKATADDVDYINAHGTSTPPNDPAEAKAINAVFGRKVPLSSTKSMIGHLLGASGAVELISTIYCMNRGVVHPTINYEEPDPECDVDCIPNEPRELKVDLAISNSFGFGGHNACLAIKRFTD